MYMCIKVYLLARSRRGLMVEIAYACAFKINQINTDKARLKPVPEITKILDRSFERSFFQHQSFVQRVSRHVHAISKLNLTEIKRN